MDVTEQDNSQYAIGMGGRYKISNRVSINADYGLHLNRASSSPYHNPFSLGVDIETGGHVFHINVTNSAGLIENDIIPSTTSDWGRGEYKLGFNISRVFSF